MEEIGPVSLDSKKSQQAKLDKLREEAQYEKERGNTFVKQEKWDDAISCYSRAIELVKDDAIYYANRGLCYLKKDSLHQAESDCTEALRLDPTYVKALQRRATARERLGSLRAASHDLTRVVELEPRNLLAKRQLDAIKARMGTKGSKSKSSPLNTPTIETKSFPTSKPKTQSKIVELPSVPKPRVIQPSAVDNWRDGIGENITVIKPVKKPPHLRSKRSLKRVPIKEVQLGKTSPETKNSTRMKIIEIDDDKAYGDTNNNDSNRISEDQDERKDIKSSVFNNMKGDMNQMSGESIKLECDVISTEKLSPPLNSVQFMAQWNYLRGKGNAATEYLSIIEPSKIPSIFENALESKVLSDVIGILHGHRDKFKHHTVTAYLKNISAVKRFSTLAMFLSASDKKLLTDLLNYCKTEEKATDYELADLKNKYEI
ncbi:unnamed protein product [Diatraea saccharalis]|uniref:RNA polymerase II-associated protein 3 n=1 Tax=Diatraea saccharalis TaxID=40085 RepID=A0A9P0G481_9NEOP|nr:unnamed protein product [Diatraea saccharalis]